MPPFNKKQDNFRARIDKKYPTKQKNNPQGFNQHKGKQLSLEKKLSDFELYQLKAKKYDQVVALTKEKIYCQRRIKEIGQENSILLGIEKEMNKK